MRPGRSVSLRQRPPDLCLRHSAVQQRHPEARGMEKILMTREFLAQRTHAKNHFVDYHFSNDCSATGQDELVRVTSIKIDFKYGKRLLRGFIVQLFVVPNCIFFTRSRGKQSTQSYDFLHVGVARIDSGSVCSFNFFVLSPKRKSSPLCQIISSFLHQYLTHFYFLK